MDTVRVDKPWGHEEIWAKTDRYVGKILFIKLIGIGEANDEGYRNVFFELNGMPREAQVLDHALAPKDLVTRQKGDANDPLQAVAPMPGMVTEINAEVDKTQGAGGFQGNRTAIGHLRQDVAASGTVGVRGDKSALVGFGDQAAGAVIGEMADRAVGIQKPGLFSPHFAIAE